jgi:hypothetical protein
MPNRRVASRRAPGRRRRRPPPDTLQIQAQGKLYGGNFAVGGTSGPKGYCLWGYPDKVDFGSARETTSAALWPLKQRRRAGSARAYPMSTRISVHRSTQTGSTVPPARRDNQDTNSDPTHCGGKGKQR